MSVRPEVGGTALVTGLSLDVVSAAVSELHHRLSSDEPEDLPAGEPPDHGDAEGVYL